MAHFLALLLALLFPSLACAQGVLRSRQVIVTDTPLTTDTELLLLRNAAESIRVQGGIGPTGEGVVGLKDLSGNTTISLSGDVAADMLLMVNASALPRVQLGISGDQGYLELGGGSDTSTLTGGSISTYSITLLRQPAKGPTLSFHDTNSSGAVATLGGFDGSYTGSYTLRLPQTGATSPLCDSGCVMEFSNTGISSLIATPGGGGGGDVFTTSANVFVTGPQSIVASTSAEGNIDIDVEHSSISANVQFRGSVYAGPNKGSGVRLRGQAARGTRASPDYLDAGDFITTHDARAWNGTTIGHPVGSYEVLANENHSVSALGVRHIWTGIEDGATTAAEIMELGGGGDLTLQKNNRAFRGTDTGGGVTNLLRLDSANNVVVGKESAFPAGSADLKLWAGGISGSSVAVILDWDAAGLGALSPFAGSIGLGTNVPTEQWDGGHIQKELVLYPSAVANTALRLLDFAKDEQISITLPTDLTKSWVLTLPPDDPVGNNYILEANTSGTLSWIPTPSGSSFTCNDAGNCVNLDGTQTISGRKTFSHTSGIKLGVDSSVTGQIEWAEASTSANLYLKPVIISVFELLEIGADGAVVTGIVPAVDNFHRLGSGSRSWNAVFSDNYFGASGVAGHSGTCASSTTLTVSSGIITGCS